MKFLNPEIIEHFKNIEVKYFYLRHCAFLIWHLINFLLLSVKIYSLGNRATAKINSAKFQKQLRKFLSVKMPTKSFLFLVVWSVWSTFL